MKNNGLRTGAAVLSLVALAGPAFAESNPQGVSQTMDLVPNAAKGMQLSNGSWTVKHYKGGPEVSYTDACDTEFVMTARINNGNKSVIGWVPRLDAVKDAQPIGFVRPGTADVSGDQIFDYSQKAGKTPDDVTPGWIKSGLVPGNVKVITLKFPGMTTGCSSGDSYTPPTGGGDQGGGGCVGKNCPGGTPPVVTPPTKTPPPFPGPQQP